MVRIYLNTIRRKYGEECLSCGMIGGDNQERGSNRFSQHYELFLLLARTGLGIGEAVALMCEDIDFNERFIKVERTYYKGRIGSTKNGKPRTVDMSWQLKDPLLNLKQGRVVVDINEEDQWVFTDTKGGLIDVDNWRRRIFSLALKRAGVKRIRIHDLRHAYATLRLSKGDKIIDVAKQLGDDVTVVLKVYSHWMPGKRRDEVDALDDAQCTEQHTEAMEG